MSTPPLYKATDAPTTDITAGPITNIHTNANATTFIDVLTPPACTHINFPVPNFLF